MTDDKSVMQSLEAAMALRKKAEALAEKKAAEATFLLEGQSIDQIRQILHELHVHQIELEMQNEELRRTQLELDASQALYFDLYDLAPVGYCTIDKEAVILQANLTICTMLGVSREDLMAKPITRFIEKDDQDIFYLCYQNLIMNGQPSSCEVRMAGANGQTYWIRVNAASVCNVNEDQVYRLILDDISEIKGTEIALSKSLEHYRAITYYANDAIITIDSNSNILWWNRAAETIFGYKEVEAIGKKLTIIIPEQFREKYDEGMQRFHESGTIPFGNKPAENIGLHLNGREFPIEQSMAMWSANGEQYFTCLIRDITERKVTEKTLRRTQKMSAIGQLTGGIAHDFNNILGIILGNAELIQKDSTLSEASIKRLGAIQTTGQRAADITKQLLNFSRTKATHPEVSNINDVITEMQNMIERSITPEVEVKQDLSDDLWTTVIDHGDFQNALLNLIINARDAMHGHGKLCINTRNITLDKRFCLENSHSRQGDFIELSVTDTGVGIPEELLDKIYEPFYSSKETGRGTGLGMSLVFSFIKRSGGFIKCISNEGVGTTFKLYFPHTSKENMVVSDLKHSDADLPRGHETVLVVDDEPLLLEMASVFLIEQGYQVFMANDGIQALDMLEHNLDIDMLISDIVMPGGLNGFELVQKASSKYPHLKVLMVSGHSGHSGKEVSSKVESRFKNNILAKPYTHDELVIIVREILDAPLRL